MFNEFKNLAGYKINCHKSTLPPLNSSATNVQYTPSIPVSNVISYLGIKIYAKLSEIIHKKYREISQKVTEDLQRWNTLPISLQGRISIVKMNILPHLNFFVFHDSNFSST